MVGSYLSSCVSFSVVGMRLYGLNGRMSIGYAEATSSKYNVRNWPVRG